jgi:hypothetical protein
VFRKRLALGRRFELSLSHRSAAATAAELDSDDRQPGKVATLGLGYQMGAKRFVGAVKANGVTLMEEEAAQIVAPWRHAGPVFGWVTTRATAASIPPARSPQSGPVQPQSRTSGGTRATALQVVAVY